MPQQKKVSRSLCSQNHPWFSAYVQVCLLPLNHGAAWGRARYGTVKSSALTLSTFSLSFFSLIYYLSDRSSQPLILWWWQWLNSTGILPSYFWITCPIQSFCWNMKKTCKDRVVSLFLSSSTTFPLAILIARQQASSFVNKGGKTAFLFIFTQQKQEELWKGRTSTSLLYWLISGRIPLWHSSSWLMYKGYHKSLFI